MISVIDVVDEDYLVAPIKEKLGIEALVPIIVNFDSDGIFQYNDLMSALIGRGSYMYAPKTFDLDFDNRVTQLA